MDMKVVLPSLTASSVLLIALGLSAQNTTLNDETKVNVIEYRAGKIMRRPTASHLQGRMPWEFMMEERLAARLDPARIAERQRADEASSGAGGTKAAVVPEHIGNYSIDGGRHPELLLPHELFNALMAGLVPDDATRTRQRMFLRAGIRASGFDEDLFWAQLSSVASEYATYKYGDAGRAGFYLSGSGRDPDQGCRLAFQALTSARQVFDGHKFDRFLYEFVAPLLQVARATNAADPAAELRRVAGGCR